MANISNLNNIHPVPYAGGNSIAHELCDIDFCRLLENIDGLQFCEMVDKLPPVGLRKRLSLTKVEPMRTLSAAFPEQTQSTCTPTQLSRDVLKAPSQQESKCRFKPFHEEKWGQKLLELRAFRKKHGHCLVPHTYPPNQELARWVKRQRRQFKLRQDGRPSTMTPDRLDILEQDGFVWDSHEAAWKEKVEDLRKYRAKHGNCLVPSNYKGNPQLATWVKCQRRQYKLYRDGKPSAMNPVRILELETEGFCWEVRRAATA